MATIKISDLRSPLPAFIGCEEEFTGAVENAVVRAVNARQLQDIRGGFKSPTTGGIFLPNPIGELIGEMLLPNPIFVGFRVVP